MNKGRTPAQVEIDLGSPVPVYRQISDAVRAQLVEGQVRPGEHLPTVRELAMELGVHHNTVAEAYRLLAEEGWLLLTRRRGVTVLERPNARRNPEAEASFARRLRELVAQAVAGGVPAPALRKALTHLAEELDR